MDFFLSGFPRFIFRKISFLRIFLFFFLALPGVGCKQNTRKAEWCWEWLEVTFPLLVWAVQSGRINFLQCARHTPRPFTPPHVYSFPPARYPLNHPPLFPSMGTSKALSIWPVSSAARSSFQDERIGKSHAASACQESVRAVIFTSWCLVFNPWTLPQLVKDQAL